MGKVVFDTNIYIYDFNGHPEATAVYDSYLGYDVIMPVIQITELLGYYQLNHDSLMMDAFEGYISSASEIPDLSGDTARLAAEIRRQAKQYNGKSIKSPDAILAATALEHDAIFISNNDRDFVLLEHLYGLKYQNPISNPSEIPLNS